MIEDDCLQEKYDEFISFQLLIHSEFHVRRFVEMFALLRKKKIIFI